MTNKVDIGGGYRSKPGFMRLDLDLSLRPNLIADAHCLPFRNEAIDEIYCSHLLEHLQDPVVAAKEVMRVLRPSGHSVFIVPNIHFPWTIYIMHKYGNRYSPYEIHRWRTNQRALKVILESVGFIVSEPLPLFDEERHWGIEYILFGSAFDLFGKGIRLAMTKIGWLNAVIKYIDTSAYAKVDSSPETKVRAIKPLSISKFEER